MGSPGSAMSTLDHDCTPFSPTHSPCSSLVKNVPESVLFTCVPVAKSSQTLGSFVGIASPSEYSPVAGVVSGISGAFGSAGVPYSSNVYSSLVSAMSADDQALCTVSLCH